MTESTMLAPEQVEPQADKTTATNASSGLAAKVKAKAQEKNQANNKQSEMSAKLNSLRAGVLGANDGIVSIAGLVVGVAAVNPANTSAIFLAGMAGLIAAAFSMSLGEYVSVSTQRDSERAVLDQHRREIAADPAGQELELAEHYMEKGLSQETAAAVARELSSADPVKAHLDAEYGINADVLISPWQAAVASFLAFLAGAALPLLTILLTPPPVRILVTYVAVVLALALTGLVSAKLGRAPVLRAVTRVVIGGALAMGVTWAIGALMGVQVG